MTGETTVRKSGRGIAIGFGVAVLLFVGGLVALPKLAEIYTNNIKKKQAQMIYGDAEAKQRRLARYEDGSETRQHDLRITDFNVEVDESLRDLIGQSTSNTMKTTIWQYLRPKDPRPPHLIRSNKFHVSEEGRWYLLFIENETVVPRKPVRQIIVKAKTKDNGMPGVIEAIGIRYKCPVKAGDYTWQTEPCGRKQR